MKYANIKLRRGTANEWTNSSPQPDGEVLKLGEPGYEKDTGKLKIGDGVNGWNNLPYINGGASIDLESVQDMIGDDFLVAGSGIELSYDDLNNTLTISNTGTSTPSANNLVAGSGININDVDPENIVISVSENYATLEEDGKIPASQLPSYVDDVLEFASSGNFPNPGSSSIIYVALDTSKTYRWGETAYFEIVASPGTTDSIIEGNNNLYYTEERVFIDSPVKNIVAGDGIVVSSSNEEFTISSLLSAINSIINGRLSLSSTDPSAVSSISNASTLYYHAYNGDIITLYDTNSTKWKSYTLSNSLNLSLASLNADTNYDIFLYDNSGTLTLQAVSWTNNGAGTSSRNANLVSQNGVLVLSGSLNKRYIGTLRTSGAGVCEDSSSKRFLYNYYNRISKRLGAALSNPHSYNVNTIRPWNNNTVYGETRYGFVVGDNVGNSIDIHLNGTLDGGVNNTAVIYVGVDSITNSACGCLVVSTTGVGNLRVGSSSNMVVNPGFHFAQCLQASVGTSSATFTNITMIGNILC